MKKRKMTFTLMTTILTLSSGVLFAQSLSELREGYSHSGERQHIRKRDYREARSVIDRRRHKEERAGKQRITPKRMADTKVKRKRELKHARKVQRRIDRKLDRKHAKRRNFHSLKEFKRQHRQTKKGRMSHRSMRHGVAPHRKAFASTSRDSRMHTRSGRRANRWYPDYDRDGIEESYAYDYTERWQPTHRQRGYRHTRRNWYLTYLYERASFYDRHGYKYGYFSRRGFMFEGEFYRYDRYYTYRDRLRGRGLFERRYYRPAYSQYGDLFAELERDGLYFYANFGF